MAYLLYAGLGLVCALVGVAIMRLVALAERLVRALCRSRWSCARRSAACCWRGLALVSPQTLSAGHGALHLDLAVGHAAQPSWPSCLLLKTTASVVSLGFGFRGGLFFASLFLGSLLGQIYAGLIDLTASSPSS